MFKEKNSSETQVSLWKMLGLAMVYLAAALIGLTLASFNTSVSPFWPAAGVSFTILYFFGYRYWPSVALGAMLANFFNGLDFPAVLLITAGNSLHGVAGIKILRFFFNRKSRFGLHTRTMGILAASLCASFISSSVGSIALVMLGNSPWEQFQSIWLTWFTGDLLGSVIYFPFFLSLFSGEKEDNRASVLQLFSMIVSGLFLFWLIFIHNEGSTYLFFLFPFLFWVCAVKGERGITLAAVLISIGGVFSAKFGYGVFKHGSLNSNLVNLELFTFSIGFSSLLMADLKKNYPLKQPGQVLFISWLLAALFFFGFYLRSAHESDKHFNQIVTAVEPMIEARLNLYFSTLQSGTGLFAASDTVDREEWKSFLIHGEFNKKLPGIDGLGVIYRVPKTELQEFVSKTRKDGAPEFNYHILPGLTAEEQQKARENNELYIVTYFEPRETNQLKIGLDLASEETRKHAADLARDLGMPTLTEKIILIDDPKKSPAFLLYYPVYTKGFPPSDLVERRKRLIGWIYTPLRAKPFFDSIFHEPTFKEIVYQVTDKNNELISESRDFHSVPSSTEDRRSIRVGNRTFHFTFRKSALFYSSQDAFSSWAGAISSVISLLIGAFILSLQNVKRNALLLAEQKTADLIASEELWKYALQAAGDYVWDWDIQSGQFKVTDELKKLLGIEKNEIDGGLDAWRTFIHPEDFAKMQAKVEGNFKEQKPYAVEYRLRTAEGQYLWILERGMVVARDQFQNAVRMVGTISNIQRFKDAEHEIESQRARLQAIYDGSSDALWLLKNDHFVDCNTRALKLFEYETKEELLKMQLAEFSPPLQPDGTDSLTQSHKLINKAYEQGMAQFEWLHRKKSGEVFPAEVTLTVFDYNGEKCIHACVRDITERKQAESALTSQREKLMAAAKMSSLGEMAGGIAHEINNPLAIIIGKISQLKRKIEAQPESFFKDEVESLTVIETTAKRISSIIKGLSAFSRNAENDKMEKLEVNTLLLDTLELSKERFRFNSTELRVNLPPLEKIYVMGRASQLLQVMVNLLNNAYDAVEFLDERWVDVSVSAELKTCRITVTDSGNGIPSHVLEKIMTPFFTTKKVGKGTGLGLSISRGIIEEHNGKLYYDSKNPHTRFVIELPLA